MCSDSELGGTEEPPSLPKAESRVLHRVLPLLSLLPPEQLLLELQPVGEEHLPPADLSGLCPHVRGDVVTGPLNDLLPEHITLAQLWGGGLERGGFGESHVLPPWRKNWARGQQSLPSGTWAGGERTENLRIAPALTNGIDPFLMHLRCAVRVRGLTDTHRSITCRCNGIDLTVFQIPTGQGPEE